jgi:hypothetical protein
MSQKERDRLKVAHRCNPHLNICYSLNSVRRGIHIAIAVLGILLLAKPFDCFAGAAWTQEAADCCKKGKCAPKADADECCKATVPGDNQFVGSKAPDHSAPVMDVGNANGPDLSFELFSGDYVFVVHSPPASPPDTLINLPLLI